MKRDRPTSWTKKQEGYSAAALLSSADMDYQKLHWLEKLKVQLVTAAGVAAVYFLFWPVLRQWQGDLPVVFVPTGNCVQGLVFAAAFGVLAGLGALATVSDRPQGALLAALIALGGVSLRSQKMRLLLWTQEDFAGLYVELMAELLCLAVLLAAGAALIDLVRGALARARPGWLWADPLADLHGEQRRKLGRPAAGQAWAVGPVGAIRTIFAAGGGGGSSEDSPTISPHRRRQAVREGFVRGLSCLLTAMLVTTIVLLLTLQSDERGQILFAVVASCVVGGLAAHQIFPTPHSLVAWCAPMAVGLLLYGLTAATAVNGGHLAWSRLPLYAQPLPIDWLTAGGGGAMVGFWISSRIHELRHLGDKSLSE